MGETARVGLDTITAYADSDESGMPDSGEPEATAATVWGPAEPTTGEVSPYYPAYDDRAATLPAVGVLLPRDGVSYTPVLTVQFFDSTYRLVGSRMVGSQTGAWMVSISTPPYGDYWYVAADDLVQCN